MLIVTLSSCNSKIEKDEAETVLLDTATTGLTKEQSSIPTFDFTGLEEAYFQPNPGVIRVVNFWATWCKPCVKELPAFEQLGAEYEDQVEVILVSLDFPEHIDKAVIPFIKEHQLKSQVVLLDDADANTWIPKVSSKWSGAIPATLIVKDGNRYFFEQSFTYEELENEIKPLL